MPESRHPVFPAAWWGSNLLLAVALIASVYSGVREFSARRYLIPYSDAMVQSFVLPQERVAALLDCMRAEPSREIAADPATMATRTRQTTPNYAQLVKVRRLRLLSSDGRAKPEHTLGAGSAFFSRPEIKE